LANHASAIKRMRQSQKRRLYNRHYRAGMRTQIKKVRAAVASGNVETATSELNAAVSIIQRLAGKKVLHRRNASRRVSRLYKAVNRLKASAS
jgi:small subunit ribosomal protein S20